MSTYLIIILFTTSLLVAYLVYSYRKKKLFDRLIAMDVVIDFSRNLDLKGNNKYGLLIFNLNSVKTNAKVILFEKVSLKSSKIQLRNYSSISTQLPIPDEGIKLSIGVRKKKSLRSQELNTCYVKLNGFILLEDNKKLHFKRTLPATFRYEKEESAA